jgi:hypothetical protein
MGVWFCEPRLLPGERQLLRAIANHLAARTRGGGIRMVGGRLVVTDRRVLFEPNRLDRITGAVSWTADLNEIRRVVLRPGGKEGFRTYGPAGARRHVLVETAGAGGAAFGVRDPHGLFAALSASLRAG